MLMKKVYENKPVDWMDRLASRHIAKMMNDLNLDVLMTDPERSFLKKHIRWLVDDLRTERSDQVNEM